MTETIHNIENCGADPSAYTPARHAVVANMRENAA